MILFVTKAAESSIRTFSFLSMLYIWLSVMSIHTDGIGFIPGFENAYLPDVYIVCGGW
jgi:hypothetical protein